MDHSELGGPFGKFHFKFIEPSEFPRVLEILEEYLYPCMIPAGYKPEGAEDYNRFFKELFDKRENVSYMAIDSETGEIACVRVVELTHKKGYDPMHVPKYFKHKVNIDGFKVYQKMSMECDLFEKFGVTEYPDMFGICTVNKYRKQGLATEMYKRGLDYLKKRGYKVVKCAFISPYSRAAGTKHGYKPYVSSRFLELKNDEGQILNPNAGDGPDDFWCIGYFDIRNRVVA